MLPRRFLCGLHRPTSTAIICLRAVRLLPFGFIFIKLVLIFW